MLTQIEEQSVIKHHTATYINQEGEEYFIVFTTDCNHNIGFTERELVNVEFEGRVVRSSDPIWLEIEGVVKNW